MGDYLRRSENVSGSAIEEVSLGAGGGGAVTAMKEVTSSSKRRKVQLSTSNGPHRRQLAKNQRRGDNSGKKSPIPASSTSSGRIPVSMRSSNDEVVKADGRARSSDLKAEEGFETEISMFVNGGFGGESPPPSSELCSDYHQSYEGGMESSSSSSSSSTTQKNTNKNNSTTVGNTSSSRRRHNISSSSAATTDTKIPLAAEIEEFFSVAEKYEQKRFADKYNYDIAKDVPLEGGRYQWVQL